MKYETTRLPKNTDQRLIRLYLTLIGHADRTGLVTTCTWTALMDFSLITRQSEVQALIMQLIGMNLIKEIETPTRSKYFRIIGNFQSDILVSQKYVMENMERVASLKNERRNGYASQKNQRTNGQTVQYSIEGLYEVARKEPKDPKKWRFTLKAAGFGTVKECIYIDFMRGPFLGGPARLVKNQWITMIDFEPEVHEAILGLINSAIANESNQSTS